MDNSIEIITIDGKTYIPDLTIYNSVEYKEYSSWGEDKIEYRLCLNVYLRYRDYDGLRVTKEEEFYYIDNREDCINYYEKIKEILSKKVEE